MLSSHPLKNYVYSHQGEKHRRDEAEVVVDHGGQTEG